MIRAVGKVIAEAITGPISSRKQRKPGIAEATRACRVEARSGLAIRC